MILVLHSTIGLIGKRMGHLEYLGGLLSKQKNQGRLDPVMDSCNQNIFKYFFGGAFFFQTVLLLFFILITDKIFIQPSINESSHFPKIEAKCRYGLFSENLMIFMALKNSFSTFYLISFVLPSMIILFAV